MPRLLALGASLAIAIPAFAQEPVPIQFAEQEWTLTGAPVEARFLGRDALRLSGARLDLMGVEHGDFVAEFDLALEPGQGFTGLFFRQDGEDAEQIYFRHHLSGRPDSFQYTPIFNGLSAWQIYASAGYWEQIDFPVGDWMRVRVVVDGSRAQISLDGDPVFDIPILIGRTSSGSLSIRNGGQAGAWLSDFAIRELTEADRLPEMEIAPDPEIDGLLIASWSVSPAFAEDRIDDVDRLPDDLPEARNELAARYRGIANLARMAGPEEDADTLLAEATLHAVQDQTVLLRFGYSDRVRIFLNGDLLFTGGNGWRSRDYRYLGTVTRSYAVPLRMRAGDNTLTMAVSEDFGGWAVSGVLDSGDGITIEP